MKRGGIAIMAALLLALFAIYAIVNRPAHVPVTERVDMKRWGGGIPLLLSGPRSTRRIAAAASNGELAGYGLDSPGMTISLKLTDGRKIDVEPGARTPDGQAYYIRLADSREVFIVDSTWYSVLKGLVTDPPYERAAAARQSGAGRRKGDRHACKTTRRFRFPDRDGGQETLRLLHRAPRQGCLWRNL